jgi:Flp pilus assembly pilin Flp
MNRVLYGLLKAFVTSARIAVFKGLGRIKTLFSSNLGLLGWFVLASVLFLDHQAAIETALNTGSVRPVLVSYASSLGSSIHTFIESLQQVPSSSGMEYAGLLWSSLSSIANVLWYFKAFYHVSAWITGDNVPPFYLILVAGLIYFLLVFAVTDWLPNAGTLEALSNLPELLDFGRVNPFTDPVNTTNGTNGTSQELLNSSS